MTDPSPTPAIDLASLQAKYDASTQGEWRRGQWTLGKLHEDGYLQYDKIEEPKDDDITISVGEHPGHRPECEPILVVGGCGCCGSPFGTKEDGEFICAIHNAFPAMAAELTAARERIAGLERENGEFERAYGREFDQASLLIETVTALPSSRDRLRKACEAMKKWAKAHVNDSHINKGTWLDGVLEQIDAALAEPKPEGRSIFPSEQTPLTQPFPVKPAEPKPEGGGA